MTVTGGVPYRGAMDAKQHTVFVYGTLLRGERNHRLLAGARFIAEAVTEPGFELADLGTYPGMAACGGDGTVTGEVYEVDAATLAALDALEEHPAYYQRQNIQLATGARAEAYLLEAAQVRGRRRIRSGEWRRRGE